MARPPDRPAADAAVTPIVSAATHPPDILNEAGVGKRRLHGRRGYGGCACVRHREAGAHRDGGNQRKQDFTHGVLLGLIGAGINGTPHSPASSRNGCYQQNTSMRLNCQWLGRSSGVHPIVRAAGIAIQRAQKIGGSSSQDDPPQDHPFAPHALHSGAPALAPVMVPVMMVPVMMVVTMMVMMMPRMPDQATMGAAVAPVMVAHPGPSDIVDDVRVDNRRPYRRRPADRRTGVRRRQHRRGHCHRCGSQAQKQLAHLCTSPRHVAHVEHIRCRPSRFDVCRVQLQFSSMAAPRRRRGRGWRRLNSSRFRRTAAAAKSRSDLFRTFCRSNPIPWANN